MPQQRQQHQRQLAKKAARCVTELSPVQSQFRDVTQGRKYAQKNLSSIHTNFTDFV